jgi:hypothetical protein
MKSRAAAVCLVAVTFAIGAVRAHAQGPPADPGAAASLAARITALEARLTAQDTRLTALETFDESDIVGSYKWVSLGIEFNRGFAGTGGTPARVGTEGGEVAFTLHADHTVQFTGYTNVDCTLPILTFGIAFCENGAEEPSPVPWTWTYADGVLTLSGDPEDEGPMSFAVPANGVIVHANANEFLPGHAWATIVVLVKQN